MSWQSKAQALGDGELVARALGGDLDAFGIIVERHKESLYRHACGMGIDHETSLDLVQDALVRGYTRLRECRDGTHVRAWLFRITRNLVLDHLKNVRRSTIPLSALSNAENVVADDVEQNDVGVTLRAALASLPLPLREAFLLKHDAGYTYDEIAELVNATPSAVKMRVHRAREALRAFLVKEGVRAA